MRFPKPAQLNGAKLAEELTTAGFPVTVFDVVVVDDELEVPVDSAASGVISAHVGEPDWMPAGPVKDWRDKLRAEVAFIDSQIATWPTNASTNQEALQRVNFLLTATKRIARNQSRILKFIDDATMDSA